MHSSSATPTTSATPSDATTPATTPATSDHESQCNGASSKPTTTGDFYVDTMFNPVWGPGPHGFPYVPANTAGRPKTFSGPHPSYQTERDRVESAETRYYARFAGQGAKPWKNVAITEEDDAEWAAIQAKGHIGTGVWRPAGGFGGEPAPLPGSAWHAQQPEWMYARPPMPGAMVPRNNDQNPELLGSWPLQPNVYWSGQPHGLR